MLWGCCQLCLILTVFVCQFLTFVVVVAVIHQVSFETLSKSSLER